MVYIEFRIFCTSLINELVIFELDQLKDISFWEHEDGLSVYIPDNQAEISYVKTAISSLQAKGFELSNSVNILPKINWNIEWESNYQPLVIAEKYYIRAPFHPERKDDLIAFTIAPKMAFGTGHHATTELIFSLLDQIDLKNKKVLDYGTGTGILAILADYKGAKEILAVDIEEEAVKSTNENSDVNHCKHISVFLGGLEQVQSHRFDVIIANINRNVLVHSASEINDLLKPEGTLLLSGFYLEDEKIITEAFNKYNIKTQKKLDKDNWIALECIKTSDQ